LVELPFEYHRDLYKYHKILIHTIREMRVGEEVWTCEGLLYIYIESAVFKFLKLLLNHTPIHKFHIFSIALLNILSDMHHKDKVVLCYLASQMI